MKKQIHSIVVIAGIACSGIFWNAPVSFAKDVDEAAACSAAASKLDQELWNQWKQELRYIATKTGIQKNVLEEYTKAAELKQRQYLESIGIVDDKSTGIYFERNCDGEL